MESHIRTLQLHRAVLNKENDSQFYGVCPFCGGKDKFYVAKDKPLWDCKHCYLSGNVEKYLTAIMAQYQEEASIKILTKLAKHRGVSVKSLKAFGVGCTSATQYMLPILGNSHKEIVNIKKYKLGERCISTAGCKSGFLGLKQPIASDTCWVCEGEWDAIALYEMLQANNIHEDVYGSPGARIAPERSLPLFNNRHVRIVYDADEQGKKGTCKLYDRILPIAKSVEVLVWPEDTPIGRDVRDEYIEKGKNALHFIKEHLRDAPQGSTKERVAHVFTGKGVRNKKVEEGFRRWLHLPNTECLDVLFGSIFANRLEGDPLWIFLVAPSGGSKTELLSSIQDSPDIYMLTTLTPKSLISGASFGGQDPSLIPKLNGRVLVIKDFTTILSLRSYDRDEIFGILRDAYDGSIEKHFGSGVVREYQSKFGIIAAVTPAIEKYSQSSSVLGERFLRFYFHHGVKASSEKTVRRSLRNMGNIEEMRKELRELACNTLDVDVAQAQIPEVSDKVSDKIVALAQYTSLLRGVVDRDPYTRTVLHKPFTEVGTRLAQQFTKAVYGISIYRREDVVSDRTLSIVRQIAQSSVPDMAENIVRVLYCAEDSSMSCPEIGQQLKIPESALREKLQDLSMLGICNAAPGRKWRLSKYVNNLIRRSEIYEQARVWKKISATPRPVRVRRKKRSRKKL